MPPDPLSRVNQVELSGDGKTVEINLQEYGFEVGAPVEISGHATQDNGAVASFHEVQEVTAVTEELAELQVVATGIDDAPFVKEEPITVIANATASWVTTLQPDNAPPPFGIAAKWVDP